MRAYNLKILNHAPRRGESDNHGWVFGLPPGIASEQWPLDPVSGYPLVHGFTLLLPEDHRCHGPDCVALSFFATPADQNDGGADDNKELAQAVIGSGARPSDPDLGFFWDRAQARHPKVFRMEDILGYAYAVILLTQAEFDGPLCAPPPIPENRYLREHKRPTWLDIGSAAAFLGEADENAIITQQDTYVFKTLGGRPEKRVDFSRAIGCTPRENDPNAGIPPRDVYDGDVADNGYRLSYYWRDGVIHQDNYVVHEWVEGHMENHIGGTMQPIQATPEFSPHYIEFEEYFGGYNFGTGNAQLDFKDMRFDWACG